VRALTLHSSVALVFSLLLPAQLVQADFGYANSKCSRWLDPVNAAEEPARRQWILGYLSAAARYADKDLSELNPNDALESTRRYCQSNPRSSLEAAVLGVVLKDE